VTGRSKVTRRENGQQIHATDVETSRSWFLYETAV
jgi:hypothetical protein